MGEKPRVGGAASDLDGDGVSFGFQMHPVNSGSKSAPRRANRSGLVLDGSNVPEPQPAADMRARIVGAVPKQSLHPW